MRRSFSHTLAPILLGAALAATAACGDDPDVETSAEELIGGFPARSPRLDAVGALGFSWSGTAPFQPVCTGTLISPQVVLTAEHCVDFVSDPTQLRFLIGFDARNPTRVVPVRGISMEQSFVGGAIGLGIDVAVLHLAEPVTGVTPFAVGSPTEAQLDTRFAAIGYGQQDALGNNGTRMAGSMTFQQIGGRMYEAIYGTFENFLADWRRYGLEPSTPENVAAYQQAWDAELLQDGIEGWFGAGKHDAQTCFGDSGGPMSAMVNGKNTVFGVASWVAYADAQTRLCDLGAAYALLNPQALDFVAYETACPMLPREGTCEGTTAVRCATPAEGGYRELRTDCEALGQICGVDPAGQVACVDDPCEGIPAEGTCDGDTAVRCSKPEEGTRRELRTDCASLGGTCGVEAGEVTCIL